MNLTEEVKSLNANNHYIRLINKEMKIHKKTMQSIIDSAFKDQYVNDFEFRMLCDYALGKDGR